MNIMHKVHFAQNKETHSAQEVVRSLNPRALFL